MKYKIGITIVEVVHFSIITWYTFQLIYTKPSINQLVEALIGYDPDVCNHCGQIGNFVTIALQKQNHQGYHLTRPYFIRPTRAGPKPVPPKYA